MDSTQYEELCRLFIAQKVGLDLDEVQSVRIPNPKRPGLPEYKHQIDLYWETGSEIAVYLNIANAKWRTKEKIEQGDVMLLQQVRQKVAAHKAFMITNIGFDAGAIAAARDEGIALHIVQPSFNVMDLPKGDRSAIKAKLNEMAYESTSTIWLHRIEHRGLGFIQTLEKPSATSATTTTSRSIPHETRILPTPSQRTSTPSDNRSVRSRETRGGPGRGTERHGGDRIVKK